MSSFLYIYSLLRLILIHDRVRVLVVVVINVIFFTQN